jgi:hypothetical protein
MLKYGAKEMPVQDRRREAAVVPPNSFKERNDVLLKPTTSTETFEVF